MCLQKTKYLFLAAAIVAVTLTGCATPQPIPQIIHPQSAALAIDVTINAPLGPFSKKPDLIYFAKIDNEESLFVQRIVPSNYSKDGRIYLLNAEPGTYVAVAALRSQGRPPTAPAQAGFSVSATMALHDKYTTYFSEEFVAITKATVQESDFFYMGTYVADTSSGLGGADEVQTHYKSVIAPDMTSNLFTQTFFGVFDYRGKVRERRADEQARQEFFQKAKEDLAGSGWAERIK